MSTVTGLDYVINGYPVTLVVRTRSEEPISAFVKASHDLSKDFPKIDKVYSGWVVTTTRDHYWALADAVTASIIAATPSDEFIPVTKFDWTSDYSFHRIMTCKNHPELRWSTKNIFARSVFFTSFSDRDSSGEFKKECDCDMRENFLVIASESQG